MNGNDTDSLDYLGGLDTKVRPEDAKKINATCPNVLKKAGLKHKSSGAKKCGRVLLIAAAITVLTAVTAAAAGFNFGDMFRGFFESYNPYARMNTAKLTQNQINAVNKSSTAINKYATSNGTTITISSAVCDNHSAYIMLDIAAPKGKKFNRSDYDFAGCSIDFHRTLAEKGLSSPMWQVLPQKDSSLNGNRMSFILQISSASLDLSNREIELTLKDLSIFNKGTFNSVLKGTWNFDFILAKESGTKTLTVNKTVHYKPDDNSQVSSGKNNAAAPQYTLKSIRLSNFSATIAISSQKEFFPSVLTVRMKDGTMARVTTYGPGYNDKSSFFFTYLLNTPIDVNNVSSVTIGDLTVPVS